MCRRVILLSLLALCLAFSAWSAPATPSSVPAALPPPAAAAPPPSGSPAWLLPAPNASTLEKPGSQAPLGAIWTSACSSACLQAEFQCINGCAGDSNCNHACSDDELCCVQACNPSGQQCN